jgi:hypothetical protein
MSPLLCAPLRKMRRLQLQPADRGLRGLHAHLAGQVVSYWLADASHSSDSIASRSSSLRIVLMEGFADPVSAKLLGHANSFLRAKRYAKLVQLVRA